MGYSAVLLPQLQSNTSFIPTDEETGSWIASLQSGVSPVGTVAGGFAMERWGRRFAMRAGLLPLFIGYIIIAFAPSHFTVLIGRFVTAISGGFSAAASSIILCEISTPRLRGLYSSSIFTALSTGVLLVYALGSYLHWHIVAGVLATIPLTSFTAFFFVPESPVWLAKKGLVEEAEDAFTWLRGDEKQAKLELQELLSSIKAQREAEVMELDISNEEEADKTPTIMQQIKILSSPSILKPFFIGHIFNLFQILTGTMLVVFYAVDMISETDKNTTGFTVAQLTAFVRLVFTLLTNTLLYYVPRRTHVTVASSVCACAALTLSCFLFFQTRTTHSLSSETSTWISTMLILVFIAANTCGFLPLPSTVMSEILPTKIRGLACSYIFAANDALQFCVSKLYPWLKDTLEMHGVFLLFGINALFCCILSHLFLPETQGKSLAEIEEYFRDKNLLWAKRDKRLGQHNMRNKYLEMKETNARGCVKTYSEEQNIKTEEKPNKCERKMSVTFS
ncbi:facilitated trehalose transporter Tret1-2 homolog isoform X2 [Zootermopsis nevadensis]|uniref:Sugar transporter ERD6-like 6 n=2 Tax=Zootermopsis nevadensis TaxID=136037 RepID=A0A067RD66_ZOONE|nr:facilitated trehalose transporter Tret1-2 homolog isoform X2 [Zootermopsis nevadensis]KDR20984.1 Sugar transporter ERD6-like 6 [Zootermopsis nevadensis]